MAAETSLPVLATQTAPSLGDSTSAVAQQDTAGMDSSGATVSLFKKTLPW